MDIHKTHTFTDCNGIPCTIRVNDLLLFNSGYKYTGRISGFYDDKMRIWWTNNHGNKEFILNELCNPLIVEIHQITKTDTAIPNSETGEDTTLWLNTQFINMFLEK